MIRVYLSLAKLSLIGSIGEPFRFVVTLLTKAIAFYTEFTLIWIMLSKLGSVKGWSKYDVLLMASLNLLAYSFAACFLLRPTSRLPDRLRTGEFDGYLGRPVSPLLYMICRDCSAGYLANLVVGSSVCFFATRHIAVTPSAHLWLVVGLAIVGGTAIFASLFVISASVSFWIKDPRGVREMLVTDLGYASRFPLAIFPSWMQWAMFLPFPTAFTTYVPLCLLSATGYDTIVVLLESAAAVVLFALLAATIWRAGIRRYQHG